MKTYRLLNENETVREGDQWTYAPAGTLPFPNVGNFDWRPAKGTGCLAIGKTVKESRREWDSAHTNLREKGWVRRLVEVPACSPERLKRVEARVKTLEKTAKQQEAEIKNIRTQNGQLQARLSKSTTACAAQRPATAAEIATFDGWQPPYVAPRHIGHVEEEAGWRILRKGETIQDGDEWLSLSMLHGPNWHKGVAGLGEYKAGAVNQLSMTWRRKTEGFPAPFIVEGEEAAAAQAVRDGYRILGVGERLAQDDEFYVCENLWYKTTHVNDSVERACCTYRRKLEQPKPTHRLLGLHKVMVDGDERRNPQSSRVMTRSWRRVPSELGFIKGNYLGTDWEVRRKIT